MSFQEQPTHSHRSRALFWVEAGLACAAGLLAVLTLFSPEWIEELFDADPDAGSGSLEWLIVVALALAAVILAVLARVEWRRTQPSSG